MNRALNVLRQFGAKPGGDPEAEPLDCPHASDCEMFALLRVAGTLRTWEIRYCSGNYRDCARHRTAELGKPISSNLMPNGQYLRFSGSRMQE
jgi:hypothetical protein